MEEVEEANKAAIESYHRVLSMLSQNCHVEYRNFIVETGEAVVRFKKVASLLSSDLGHARVRKHKKLQIPFSQSILLDNPNCKTNHHSKNMQQLPQTSFIDNSVQELGPTVKNSLYVGNPSLELSSNERSPLHPTQQTSSTHYHLLQQQQMKPQAEMRFRRNSSVINLNIDSSSYTPSMSSTRSFISSLSIDGSMANLDGSAFHLLGAAHSSD
ncbi:WRKY transcription factor 39 [Spatholobus suberectus]|nr:WRKY transcription factor 39 [Spatholobus suberectus]